MLAYIWSPPQFTRERRSSHGPCKTFYLNCTCSSCSDCWWVQGNNCRLSQFQENECQMWRVSLLHRFRAAGGLECGKRSLRRTEHIAWRGEEPQCFSWSVARKWKGDEGRVCQDWKTCCTAAQGSAGCCSSENILPTSAVFLFSKRDLLLINRW